MKRTPETIISFILLLCILWMAETLPAFAAASSSSRVIVKTITIITIEPNFAINGAYHELEEGLLTKPIVVEEKTLSPDARVLAPLKDIIETIGGTFSWSDPDKTATLTLNDNKVKVSAGKTQATVNGEGKTIDAAIVPRIANGSIFLPVQFVMASLGCDVSWEKSRTRLVVTAYVKPTPETLDMIHGGHITYETMLNQPLEWYGSAEARQIADNVLRFQNKDGGWIKLDRDIDMSKPIHGPGSLNVRIQSTIDNNATFCEMQFLARVYNAAHIQKYKDGFNRGLEYILSGQYPNGGWPQFFPGGIGYQKHITYNDNAMANILNVIRSVMNREGDFKFADDRQVAQCSAAFNKGVDCILKSQIAVNGKKTAWCAQIDENTLEPVVGRAYELKTISGQESVNVIKFLMSIDHPGTQIIEAVQAGVSWFNAVKINGIKVVTKTDPTMEFGGERFVVNDQNAPVIWARFYEIGTNKPIFSSRDGIARYDLADISYERRNRYSWYTYSPADLLTRDYQAWQQKWGPGHNVLQSN